MQPLHIRPGQLVELAVGFIVAPTGKAKLSLKRRFFSVCVLDTSFQEVSLTISWCTLILNKPLTSTIIQEFNSTIPRSPKPTGKLTVQRYSPYARRSDKGNEMDQSS